MSIDSNLQLQSLYVIQLYEEIKKNNIFSFASFFFYTIILFLSAKRLNTSDIHREISAVKGEESIFKDDRRHFFGFVTSCHELFSAYS